MMVSTNSLRQGFSSLYGSNGSAIAPRSKMRASLSPHLGRSLLGGSLCEVSDVGPLIHKYYKGDISRGHEKIFKEYIWYQLVPDLVRAMYPQILPVAYLGVVRSTSVADDDSLRPQTSLYMQKFERRTLSKLVLVGAIEHTEAVAWLQQALRLLFKVVYPMRSRFGVKNLYEKYHQPRLELAFQGLAQVSRFSSFFEKEDIIVNGQEVPSLRTFLSWVEQDRIKNLLEASCLVAMHGNLHPDNILVADQEAPSSGGITFIDPRGDLLGPLYYDSSKLMTSLHSHYDEIHYGAYSTRRIGSREYQIEVSCDFDDIYSAMLEVLADSLTDWAIYSCEDFRRFVQATVICEAIHTASFSFYHLNRIRPDIDRVEAFLVTACCLAALAQKAVLGEPIEGFYAQRLDYSRLF